ncbi:putative membrane transporter protein [Neofusicoccum parvum UCRNP2]|uniref:Putative membrane transporter protein n=1 Tax=Botryosphaeria parva (strain UCR-NP2) TaxID=1287680 RepID=R1EG72_BOTPV|nr:putative membrane transporter protein [Neofusicoccum parvum UCRNP2]
MAADQRPSIEEHGVANQEEISQEKKPAVAEEPDYDFEESKGALRHMNRVGDVIDTAAVQPGTDLVYERKVALLNEAILDIGMGHYQWWTFILTGFGWYTDQTGGNQAIDSCIFLEFIPASHQYLLTMQTTFFALAQAISVLIAWPFVVNYSCSSDTPDGECGYLDNLGWRYAYWTFGAINFAMFAARFIFRTYETPKWLLGQGRDEEAVRVIQKVAGRNGTETWLTIEHLRRIDAELAAAQDPNTSTAPPPAPATSRLKTTILARLQKFQPTKLRALFSTPRMAASTALIVLLWLLLGLAFPLYFCFIPLYLEAKGLSSSGGSSTNATFRTYCLQAASGVPGAVLSGLLVDVRRVGRKGTGALASVLSGVFLFLYTRAASPAAVTGFSCAIAFFQNMAMSLLYSYSPELFPAPIRGTGNGLTAMFNRLGGLMAPIIAAYVGVTNTPIWVSAALFIVIGFIFVLLPYETRGKAAS